MVLAELKDRCGLENPEIHGATIIMAPIFLHRSIADHNFTASVKRTVDASEEIINGVMPFTVLFDKYESAFECQDDTKIQTLPKSIPPLRFDRIETDFAQMVERESSIEGLGFKIIEPNLAPCRGLHHQSTLNLSAAAEAKKSLQDSLDSALHLYWENRLQKCDSTSVDFYSGCVFIPYYQLLFRRDGKPEYAIVSASSVTTKQTTSSDPKYAIILSFRSFDFCEIISIVGLSFGLICMLPISPGTALRASALIINHLPRTVAVLSLFSFFFRLGLFLMQSHQQQMLNEIQMQKVSPAKSDKPTNSPSVLKLDALEKIGKELSAVMKL